METSKTLLLRCGCNSTSSLCRLLITSHWLWILKVGPLLFYCAVPSLVKAAEAEWRPESLHVHAAATVGRNEGVTTSIHLSAERQKCVSTQHTFEHCQGRLKKKKKQKPLFVVEREHGCRLRILKAGHGGTVLRSTVTENSCTTTRGAVGLLMRLCCMSCESETCVTLLQEKVRWKKKVPER